MLFRSVTGGSRGLGLQMAEVLGELGARVAITARKQHELDAAAAHLKALGIDALPIVCDMSALGQKRTSHPSSSRRFNNDWKHCIWRRVSRNHPVNRQPIPLLSAIYYLGGDCLLNRGDVRNAQRCDRWGDLLRNSQNAGNAHNIWERIQSDGLHAHDSTQSDKLQLTRWGVR